MKLILEKDLEMVNVARADEVEASWAASAKASALSQVSRGLNANSPVWTWTKEKTLSVRSDSQSENGNKQTASGLKPSTVFLCQNPYLSVSTGDMIGKVIFFCIRNAFSK